MPKLSLKIYIGNIDIHPNTHLKNSEITTKQKQGPNSRMLIVLNVKCA